MLKQQTRSRAEARPTSPAQTTTLCSGCAFRFDFSHDCRSHQQEHIESPIGLNVITQCSGFVPATTEQAVR